MVMVVPNRPLADVPSSAYPDPPSVWIVSVIGRELAVTCTCVNPFRGMPGELEICTVSAEPTLVHVDSPETVPKEYMDSPRNLLKNSY